MKILIIDDEAFFIENLAQYLEKKISAAVDYVTTAEAAVDKLAREKFDLVICDLNLPDQSEGEMVTIISRMNRQQGFIIISAKSEQEIPEFLAKRKHLRILGYFEKPFNMELIEEKIKVLANTIVKDPIQA